MKFEGEDTYSNVDILYDKCRRLLYYHVIFIPKDYSTFDGIIKSVDKNRIIVLVGKDIFETKNKNHSNHQRQYDYDEDTNLIVRYRRFEPRDIPLTDLSGLYLLPYPNIFPQVPYYPSHPAYHLDYPK
ncbi:hypothetical protein ACN077_05790 [Clostridium chromiireducens]|uniref:hypothetical protein n=1 Tax=Clostridium chromiireducens TaxID=225345 RepID=UPI003AF4C8CC